MDQLVMESRGKINRGLKILGKRPDGYHNLDSIMVPISLRDTITLTKRDRGLVYESNLIDLDWTPDNFCKRALDLLEEKLGRTFSLEIQLEKRIPLGAGLAGGTANGASILKGLNQLYDLKLDLKDLQAWALDLGADFPFCLYDRPARVQGIGEKIQPLEGKEEAILLVNPGYQLSTPEVYAWYDQDMDQGIQDQAINDLEGPVLRRHPQLVQVRESLEATGAYEVSMSGSGPTFYAVYENQGQRDQAKEKLEGTFEKVLACSTVL